MHTIKLQRLFGINETIFKWRLYRKITIDGPTQALNDRYYQDELDNDQNRKVHSRMIPSKGKLFMKF